MKKTQRKKDSVPVFIVQEHHEAFITWYYSVINGFIPPNGNVLFHVDDHSDMGAPRFNQCINELNGNLDEVKNFTYNELGIATFIIPAVYKDFFNKVYWIRQQHPKKKSVELYVRSYNNGGKRLIKGLTKAIANTNTLETDIRKFNYYLRTIHQIPGNANVILDIDLDYFSCCENPSEMEEINVEITKSEYEEFKNNKYHRLNYIHHKIEAMEIDGNYFYSINNFDEIYPTAAKVSNDVIKTRINDFISVLKAKNINPLIIDICRSRFSGYTPKDQWEFIEHHLMDQLSNLYDCKIITLN